MRGSAGDGGRATCHPSRSSCPASALMPGCHLVERGLPAVGERDERGVEVDGAAAARAGTPAAARSSCRATRRGSPPQQRPAALRRCGRARCRGRRRARPSSRTGAAFRTRTCGTPRAPRLASHRQVGARAWPRESADRVAGRAAGEVRAARARRRASTRSVGAAQPVEPHELDVRRQHVVVEAAPQAGRRGRSPRPRARSSRRCGSSPAVGRRRRRLWARSWSSRARCGTRRPRCRAATSSRPRR